MSDPSSITWEEFIGDFYGEKNGLNADQLSVVTFVDQAHRAWSNSVRRPFFLPAEYHGWPCWYVICPDRTQRLWAGDLVRAHAGSWGEYKAQPIPSSSTDLLDPPVLALLQGTNGSGYRFLSARPSTQYGSHLTTAFARLGRALESHSPRRVNESQPIGRLIADFSDACAEHAEETAHSLLRALDRDQRISRLNKLFLRVQFLAAFARWADLEALPQFRDLLNLSERPRLVSDALARWVVDRLPLIAEASAFLDHSQGALVPSTSSIRSLSGAIYYAFWALANAEPADAIVRRLESAGWQDAIQSRADLSALLAAPRESIEGSGSIEHADRKIPSATVFDAELLRQAMGEGRLDTAVDLLATTTPSGDLLPVLTQIFTRTFSGEAFELLQQWRDTLGSDLVEDGFRHIAQAGVAPGSTVVAELGMADILADLFATTTAAPQRARGLEDLRAQWVPALVRPGELGKVVQASTDIVGSLDTATVPEFVDCLLDLEIDLVRTDYDVPKIQDLRRAILDCWAIGDESGNRRRAQRIIDLIDRLLAAGVGPGVFDHVVQDLEAAWPPFQNNASLPLGLDTIEVMAAYQPDGDTRLAEFAGFILSRIGAHNRDSLDRSCLQTGASLARQFGLDAAAAVMEQSDTDRLAGASNRPDELPADTTGHLAIYSLMSAAARRAQEILTRRFPSLKVELLVGTVATDPLRRAARTADVLVIADKAAAHAATDALKRARGEQAIEYAGGKGSVSLIEAAVRGLQAVQGQS